MKLEIYFPRIQRSTISRWAFLLVILCISLAPAIAFASQGDGPLPFEGPLNTLKDSITGPFAFVVSIIGIVAAGAMLIFGGDMSGFMRTLVFLVLVIAVIVGASNMMEKVFNVSGADIAHLDGAEAQALMKATSRLA